MVGDSRLVDAFRAICETAEESAIRYVSLYVNVPFYGGPEEGGWWGTDTELIATYQCQTESEAGQIYERIESYVADLNKEAEREHNKHCLHQWQDEERRGYDSNDLYGEVDGAEQYWVTVEEQSGSCKSRGDRQWS